LAIGGEFEGKARNFGGASDSVDESKGTSDIGKNCPHRGVLCSDRQTRTSGIGGNRTNERRCLWSTGDLLGHATSINFVFTHKMI
jgi:hypothetical protein